MPPETPTPRPRPMVRVERTLTGPDGVTATVTVTHPAGRTRAALYLVDEAAAAVKARVIS